MNFTLIVEPHTFVIQQVEGYLMINRVGFSYYFIDIEITNETPNSYLVPYTEYDDELKKYISFYQKALAKYKKMLSIV